MTQSYRRFSWFVLSGIFFAGALLGFVLYAGREDALFVTILDVGQGDAILVSQGSQQVLIDGGRNGTVLLERLGEYIPFWDKSIEGVIVTHPDEDHIGGLSSLSSSYKIGLVLGTNASSTSKAYQKWNNVMEEYNIPFTDTYHGMNIHFSGGSVLEVLHPFFEISGGSKKDTNDTSIATRLVYGENEFLFTGDLSSDIENMLPVGESVDILKAGHHGSKHSTSNAFLEKVSPADIIFSAGEKNRYGHPAQETLERAQAKALRIFRTDTQGNIQYRCEKEENSCEVVTRKM